MRFFKLLKIQILYTYTHIIGADIYYIILSYFINDYVINRTK